jgi:hypothetical protein
MFAIQLYRDSFQSAVCMFLAAVIVSSSLAVGALGVHVAEQDAIAAMARA